MYTAYVINKNTLTPREKFNESSELSSPVNVKTVGNINDIVAIINNPEFTCAEIFP